MEADRIQIHHQKDPHERSSLQVVRDPVHLLSGKWKIQVIAFLMENGKTRFMDIQRGVDGISYKVLAKELQQMEQAGSLERIAADAKLTVIEYELTAQGYTLRSLLSCITDLGKRRFQIGISS